MEAPSGVIWIRVLSALGEAGLMEAASNWGIPPRAWEGAIGDCARRLNIARRITGANPTRGIIDVSSKTDVLQQPDYAAYCRGSTFQRWPENPETLDAIKSSGEYRSQKTTNMAPCGGSASYL